jgi:biofilm PGA synthesis lipoprotein PgaB
MILRIITGLFLMTALLMPLNSSAQAAPSQGVIILCYHDVGKIKTAYSTASDTLESHFSYLRDHGYTPISLDQYIAAGKGTVSLPPNPVLLSFDDGYASFYTEVYPLLKKYNYPAMMAIITSWQEGYVNSNFGPVLNWDQIKEMDKSGLVAFASHSHDSHRYFPINAFGDTGITLESFQYLNGRYESLEQYKNRIGTDLRRSQQAFNEHLGHPVKAMVWPFGGYTQFGVEVAQQYGFEAFLGLEGGFNLPNQLSLTDARRAIIMNNMPVSDFAKYLQVGGEDKIVINAAQLDIDMIYDPKDPAQTERNLDLTLTRFSDANVNVVFLQTFSDADGSGNITSVYFHTDKAPVKADLFSHVAARLRAAGIRVYAWFPTLSNQWLLKGHPEDAIVAEPASKLGWYKRATPFSPRVHELLKGLVVDLVSYSYVDGILFQDDLYLNDFEDYSPSAKAAFRQATGRELEVSVLEDKQLRDQWTTIKTEALTNLTAELIQTAKLYRPYLRVARNIYPTLLTQPASQEWLAQNFQDYLLNYDYTVIMAYPYLEKQYDHPLAWLADLASKALRDKQNANKVIFKLQAYDWNKNRWLTAKELRQQQDVLKAKGAIHFAYYPENVFGSE